MVPPDYHWEKVQRILEGDDMTDKEIVQALRCCAKGLGHDDACENCKVGEIQNRREYIEFAAANVIERLTAENAALRGEGAAVDQRGGTEAGAGKTRPCYGRRVCRRGVPHKRGYMEKI
jgi:hypothetical protein